MEIAVGLVIGLLTGITTTAYMMEKQQERNKKEEARLANIAISNREKAIDRKNEALAEMKIIINSKDKKLKEIKRIVEEPDLGNLNGLKIKIKSVLDESSKSI